MINQKIKIGYVVKTNKDKIGCIVYFKDNDNIGINCNHYHIVTNVYAMLSKKEQLDFLLKLGIDEILSKHEIIEILKEKSLR